jgi:hypothetical protein
LDERQAITLKISDFQESWAGYLLGYGEVTDAKKKLDLLGIAYGKE